MPEKPKFINVRGNLLDISVPRVSGIINITPDSFYSGSRFMTEAEIVRTAFDMIVEGADIIDVGGYSSRPGAEDISEEEEKKRVLNAVKLISREMPEAIISVDTFRSEVAKEAVYDCGAGMINDITAGEADPRMYSVIESLNVPYVMMHMQGNPRTMQVNPVYDDVVADILRWFGDRTYRARAAGIRDIIVDPGFGFGKTISQNFKLLQKLGDFCITGLPLMVGLSRKSMIYKTLDISTEEALNGTTVLNTVALLNGADILRVHDVKEAVQAVRLVEKIKKSNDKQ
ncbi:MAG: dihydropteroate synthase [Bacteroidales bacterium]|nr:dihydropteroate synthase [Bacteroidales bacterium]HQG78369.1 dihydropteroate synthase [Bacteroidales bacterium]